MPGLRPGVLIIPARDDVRRMMSVAVEPSTPPALPTLQTDDRVDEPVKDLCLPDVLWNRALPTDTREGRALGVLLVLAASLTP